MLAYVFSHRTGAGADIEAYEESLRSFHAALVGTSPDGYISSATFRVDDGYADWYLLADSAALDVLNAAAVSGARSAPHDAAARIAVDGVGKLFSLASGEPLTASGFEVRFAKPKGMSYADLYARLKPWTGAPGVSLWRRMMVLGPSPEFSIITASQVELPPEMQPMLLTREPI